MSEEISGSPRARVSTQEEKRTPFSNLTNHARLSLSAGAQRVPVKEKTPSKSVVSKVSSQHFMKPTESSKTNVVALKSPAPSSMGVVTPARKPRSSGMDAATPTSSLSARVYASPARSSPHVIKHKQQPESESLMTPPRIRPDKIASASADTKTTKARSEVKPSTKSYLGPVSRHRLDQHEAFERKASLPKSTSNPPPAPPPGRLSLKSSSSTAGLSRGVTKKNAGMSHIAGKADQSTAPIKSGGDARRVAVKQKPLLTKKDSQASLMSAISLENSLVEVSMPSFDDTFSSVISDVYGPNSLMSTGLVSLWDDIQRSCPIEEEQVLGTKSRGESFDGILDLKVTPLEPLSPDADSSASADNSLNLARFIDSSATGASNLSIDVDVGAGMGSQRSFSIQAHLPFAAAATHDVSSSTDSFKSSLDVPLTRDTVFVEELRDEYRPEDPVAKVLASTASLSPPRRADITTL